MLFNTVYCESLLSTGIMSKHSRHDRHVGPQRTMRCCFALFNWCLCSNVCPGAVSTVLNRPQCLQLSLFCLHIPRLLEPRLFQAYDLKGFGLQLMMVSPSFVMTGLAHPIP